MPPACQDQHTGALATLRGEIREASRRESPETQDPGRVLSPVLQVCQFCRGRASALASEGSPRSTSGGRWPTCPAPCSRSANQGSRSRRLWPKSMSFQLRDRGAQTSAV